MRICVLSSGSVGNATIIETENTAILIDNGLSLKKLQELLKKVDLTKIKLSISLLHMSMGIILKVLVFVHVNGS